MCIRDRVKLLDEVFSVFPLLDYALPKHRYVDLIFALGSDLFLQLVVKDFFALSQFIQVSLQVVAVSLLDFRLPLGFLALGLFHGSGSFNLVDLVKPKLVGIFDLPSLLLCCIDLRLQAEQ